ncbi:MAG: amino acid ABC transporter substrate-binding protein [Rhodospirillaceae bacterium TMED167]|nr:MAG: amino acid ABC transporter substrate-binding protein [Rhodospirillaceae bacterium TMED167]
MKVIKTSLTLLLGLLLILPAYTGALAGETQQQLTSESVIETIKKRGKLMVGMSTFVPWAMRNKQGELIGFEIDVAKKVAEDMGVDIEFVPTQWSGIIPALIAGKFDAIIGGMSVTPQRNLTISFTAPYAHSGLGIAASKKLAGDFAWPEGFNRSDVIFVCRRGVTPCTDAVAKIWPKAKVRQFDDDTMAFQEVVNGNAHATLSSHPKPVSFTYRYPDALYMPTTENLSRGDEAFGIRKGDPDALNFFSNWIMINTSNGWLEKRHHYWFKTMDWADQVDQQ